MPTANEIKEIEKELLNPKEFFGDENEIVENKTTIEKQIELPGIPSKTELGKQVDKVLEIQSDLKQIMNLYNREKNKLLNLMLKEKRDSLNYKDSGNKIEIKITKSKEKININLKKEK